MPVFNDKRLGDANGAFYPGYQEIGVPGRIGMKGALSDRDFVSTLLHEMQHGVQKHEGWLSGSNMQNHDWVGDAMVDRRVYEAAQEYQNWLAQTRRRNDLNSFSDWKSSLPKGTDTTDVFGKSLHNTPEDLHRKIMEVNEQLGPVKDTYDAYRRHPGEVEAHNVQARLSMDSAERRIRPPWETQYVQDGYYTRNPGETFDNLKQYVKRLKP